ncbi:DUF2268 domain-containing protein [Brevibacillus humidisoli]|uniref:DUF2268 domain-containing putative Zn-dependent protease n=1 Tax=Brevibacillus humidisoli TaxID=2895522 RepID=UPI001E2BD991|nr:DUF2268 domain-containing putative Zn-dependent protease [Brevibacillus humidisoli]UFJ39360.1 DUF2268 domain-containing protein [Brevibacillus humidisoli]
MIYWHWLYRDFLQAYTSSTSKDWVEQYRQHYWRPNQHLLQPLHYAVRGYPTEELVASRIASLGRSRFDRLVDSVGQPAMFEQMVVSAAGDLLQRLSFTPDGQDVYVIVGLDCTNIYSVPYEGRMVTVICLEAVDGQVAELQLLLAHEFHHWLRQSPSRENLFEQSVGQRLVTEGLAACFTKETFPGRTLAEYCFVPEETVNWTIAHIDKLNHLLVPHLYRTELIQALFSRAPSGLPIEGMPLRTGYAYAMLLIQEQLNRRNLTAQQAALLPWEQLLGIDTRSS